jgi:hypothetical protein
MLPPIPLGRANFGDKSANLADRSASRARPDRRAWGNITARVAEGAAGSIVNVVLDTRCAVSVAT